MSKIVKNFVYPVLRVAPNDDIKPSLSKECMKVNVTDAGQVYCISVRLNYENEDIESLIKDEYATYTCEVSCACTYFKMSIKSVIPDFKFHLQKKDVCGRIDITSHVTVIKEIPNYKNRFQNEDYGDTSFYMEQGDVLAIFGTYSLYLGARDVNLHSAGSILKIYEKNDAEDIWVDVDGDYIKVLLPSNMYGQFNRTHNNEDNNEVFHASIVLYALTKAILLFNENHHSNLKWALVLQYMIKHEASLQGYDLNDNSKAPDLANAILHSPIRRLLEKLDKEK